MAITLYPSPGQGGGLLWKWRSLRHGKSWLRHGKSTQLYPSPGQGGGYCENDVDCVMGRVDCVMGNPLNLYPSPGQGGCYCENDVVCVMGNCCANHCCLSFPFFRGRSVLALLHQLFPWCNQLFPWRKQRHFHNSPHPDQEKDINWVDFPWCNQLFPWCNQRHFHNSPHPDLEKENAGIKKMAQLATWRVVTDKRVFVMANCSPKLCNIWWFYYNSKEKDIKWRGFK